MIDVDDDNPRYIEGRNLGAEWAASEDATKDEIERVLRLDPGEIGAASTDLAAAELFADATGMTFPEMFARPSREFVSGFVHEVLAHVRANPDRGAE